MSARVDSVTIGGPKVAMKRRTISSYTRRFGPSPSAFGWTAWVGWIGGWSVVSFLPRVGCIGPSRTKAPASNSGMRTICWTSSRTGSDAG